MVATYREFAPTSALRGYVRAYFSFTPGAAPWHGRHVMTREVRFGRNDSFCSPRFADGHASLVADLGRACDLAAGWMQATPVRAHAMGALRAVAAPAGRACAEMVGAYLAAGATAALLHASAPSLTDRTVDLADLWGPRHASLAADLAGLSEPTRVAHLEALLLARLRRARATRRRLDIPGLARWARSQPAAMTVQRLADAAGVSRQHLGRAFREALGVSPKRYCRLARFQAGLVHADAGHDVAWAEVAPVLGYADQSHMIAEFRELAGLTPQTLAARRWFHPFILDARERFAAP